MRIKLIILTITLAATQILEAQEIPDMLSSLAASSCLFSQDKIKTVNYQSSYQGYSKCSASSCEYNNSSFIPKLSSSEQFVNKKELRVVLEKNVPPKLDGSNFIGEHNNMINPRLCSDYLFN